MTLIEDLISKHGWSDEEARGRNAICEIGKLCYSRNYIAAADGNLSMKLSDGTILITPSGAMKGFLSPNHLAHIDDQGKVVDSGPGPSSEVGIHLVAYHERPDVKAVLHCHPPHAVALTVAGIDLQMPVIPEIVVTIGGIPTAPYGTPGTPELAETIRDIVRCSDTMIMKNHGSVCVGDNLLDAYKKLDMLEHTARILWLAHAVGGVEPLGDDEVKKTPRDAHASRHRRAQHAGEPLRASGALSLRAARSLPRGQSYRENSASALRNRAGPARSASRP